MTEQTQNGQPEIMSLAETSAFLRMEYHAVSQLARARKLPGRKVGREWRFSRAALLRWLEQPTALAAR